MFSGISAALFLPPGRRHNLVPYLAAKGGILALTRALAREVGDWGIRVSPVAPDSDFMTGQTVCVDGGWVAH